MRTSTNNFIQMTRDNSDDEEINAAIDDVFDFKPWDRHLVEKTTASKLVVASLKAAVKTIIEYVPPSADRTAAIRKLREARMDCNSALTHDGKY